MQMWIGIGAVIAWVVALQLAEARLVNVQVLSRHGNRAPGDVVSWLCPNDHLNTARYTASVDYGGMTGRGMTQMVELGRFIRRQYMTAATAADATEPVPLLTSKYSESEVYFRASGATRCMQSAQCVGYGMYPPTSAPPGTSRSLRYVWLIMCAVH